MKESRLSWIAIISVVAFAVLPPSSSAQVSVVTESHPLVTDWTSHHVVFSRPADSARGSEVRQDLRYRQQTARQRGAKFSPPLEGAKAAPSRMPSASPFLNDQYTIGGDWSEDMGSGATVGATNYPAKYAFNTSIASCANDFVVYATGLKASPTQASIVAFNNIYSGCGGTVPSVYWAYDITGTIVTSPVFSEDGTQLAFVQKGGEYPYTLIMLKWAAAPGESVSSPAIPTHVVRNLYPACVAPCYTSLPLRNASAGTLESDTGSSFFYDYLHDTGYVGDDAGYLHQFTPIFKGIPEPVYTGGWPVLLNPASPTPLTSPVLDNTSGNVYVADQGGFVYAVSSTTASVTTSTQLDFSLSEDGGPGIVQGPMIDSTAGVVYVFAPSDGSGSCIGGTDCPAVFLLPSDFTSSTLPGEAVVGASTAPFSTAPNPLYIGAFDSTYINSRSATGNLYVCGNTGGPPILYQVSMVAGALNTVNAGPPISTSSSIPCSPVTDIYNSNVSGGATEWIFASTQDGGSATTCAAGGCIFNFKDTPWQASTSYHTVGQEVLDTRLQIEVVIAAGTSGAHTPSWPLTTLIGRTTTDGTVTWINQGVISSTTPSAWASGQTYSKNTKILDSNNNIELVTKIPVGFPTCTSGATTPGFSMTAGITTTDGTCTWTNVGAIATAAMATAGGTSGIILDNTVSTTVEPGASQIYFSTLGDQACGTSGTGGCAIQASQTALQ